MSNFFNQSQDFTLQECFIGCLLCTVYIDGEMSDEETDGMVLGFIGRSIFTGYDAQPAMKKYIFKLVGDDDKNAILRECCSGITAEWKPTVFAMCCDLIFKDRIISNEERTFLKQMKEYLALPDDTTNKIIEVISWMYKGKI